MIKIPVLTDNVISPSVDIPDNVIGVICDGNFYHCFEPGDTIPDFGTGETIEQIEESNPGLFTRIINWMKGVS